MRDKFTVNAITDDEFLAAVTMLVENNGGNISIDRVSKIISIDCESHEDEMRIAELVSTFFGKFEV